MMKQTIPQVTTFGLGHLRPFPGSWGSLPTVVVAGILVAIGLGPNHHAILFNLAMVVIAIIFTAFCVVYGDEAEAVFLKKDPSNVVADETAGQAVTLLALPAAAVETPGRAIVSLVFALIAFRAMDILKPWPAQQIQAYPAGWGVVLDDLMAGVYALIIVQSALRWAW
jgi:phosphatidylglycerophosphatase A